ncbi:MAG: glyoxalase [Saprospiraceae bacterium]
MSVERSQQLLSIRLAIPTATTDAATSDNERFQNLTLRPILKFQHELLLQLFRHYAERKKNIFFQLAMERRVSYIEKALSTDLNFRNELKGVIIGHFTTEEYLIYTQNTMALNKRIFGMLKERLSSSVAEL